MSIFSRLGDIINSNINALLDRAEDPAKLMRSIIQEMEDTLVEVRSSAAKVLAEKKQVMRNLSRIKNKQEDWQQKASLAIEKEREDLAKIALLERARLQELANELKEQLDFIDEDLNKLEEDVVLLQEKIAAARKRQQQIAQRNQTAKTQLKVRSTTSESRLAKALEQLDQIEQRTERLEADVESHSLGKDKSVEDHFSELESTSQVEEELQRLKEKLAHNEGKA